MSDLPKAIGTGGHKKQNRASIFTTLLIINYLGKTRMPDLCPTMQPDKPDSPKPGGHVSDPLPGVLKPENSAKTKFSDTQQVTKSEARFPNNDIHIFEREATMRHSSF